MPCVGTILIIDTDAPTRAFLADALGEEGYTTWIAQSATCALTALALYRPDLMLLDLPLLGSTPLDSLAAVQHTRTAGLPLIVMSTNRIAAEASRRRTSRIAW
jgi:DNA-binding response OmpR family regulator